MRDQNFYIHCHKDDLKIVKKFLKYHKLVIRDKFLTLNLTYQGKEYLEYHKGMLYVYRTYKNPDCTDMEWYWSLLSPVGQGYLEKIEIKTIKNFFNRKKKLKRLLCGMN